MKNKDGDPELRYSPRNQQDDLKEEEMLQGPIKELGAWLSLLPSGVRKSIQVTCGWRHRESSLMA